MSLAGRHSLSKTKNNTYKTSYSTSYVIVLTFSSSFPFSSTAAGLSDAISSLSAGGTPPKWVVIDDGWQCTDLDPEFKSWEELKLPGLLGMERVRFSTVY
jgi:hypothetical protein